jgi:C4-dicarboxylate-specific signal transduction histidine kinase
MSANKTAVSGALSASIAHEINQPLGAIKINSQHLSMLIKGKKEKVIIDNIIKDNDKAAKIISTLKNIFVSKDNSFKRVNFERFIKSINPLFEDATRDKNISMKLIINSPVEININPDEVQQALFNLLNNSIQALSKSSKKK